MKLIQLFKTFEHLPSPIYLFSLTMVTFHLRLYIGPLWPAKYWKIQQLDYSTNHKWHKQSATELLKLLNKYLLLATIRYGKRSFTVVLLNWWRGFVIMLQNVLLRH